MSFKTFQFLSRRLNFSLSFKADHFPEFRCVTLNIIFSVKSLTSFCKENKSCSRHIRIDLQVSVLDTERRKTTTKFASSVQCTIVAKQLKHDNLNLPGTINFEKRTSSDIAADEFSLVPFKLLVKRAVPCLEILSDKLAVDNLAVVYQRIAIKIIVEWIIGFISFGVASLIRIEREFAVADLSRKRQWARPQRAQDRKSVV